MTKISLRFDDQSTVQMQSVSPYGRVMDTIEEHGMSRPTWRENDPDAGRPLDPKVFFLPDVYRINPVVNRNDLFTMMTKQFQFWIYRINLDRMFGYRMSDTEFWNFYDRELVFYKLKDYAEGDTIRQSKAIFRAKASHTNSAGYDDSAFFIGEERMDEQLPRFSNIVTGRWVGIMNERNQFDVINASKGFLHLHPDTHPHLFDEPMSTGRALSGNVILRDNLRNSYGFFNGKAVMPVMLPFDDRAVVVGRVIRTNEEPLQKFENIK